MIIIIVILSVIVNGLRIEPKASCHGAWPMTMSSLHDMYITGSKNFETPKFKCVMTITMGLEHKYYPRLPE